MEYFVGIDVSLATSAVCVICGRGEVVREAKVASEPEALTAFILGQPFQVTAVGFEAGPLSQWLHKALAEAAVPVVLMETRQVKAVLKAMPLKTDRRDAEGIARRLADGLVPTRALQVGLGSGDARAARGAAGDPEGGARRRAVGSRGVLRNFGLKLGRISRGGYAARVRELASGNEMLETMAEAMLRAREALRAELAGLERRLRDLARHDPVCRLMTTMPGVGPVVALTVKSAIDAPERFRSSKDVGPWAGLTPGRRQSGETDIVGGITRAGDGAVRTALYQAATVMMHRSRPSWSKAWGLQVARRRGMKRAVVAVARRIGVILHRMWADGAVFRLARTEALATPA